MWPRPLEERSKEGRMIAKNTEREAKGDARHLDTLGVPRIGDSRRDVNVGIDHRP
jgi:hypothetical protein